MYITPCLQVLSFTALLGLSLERMRAIMDSAFKQVCSPVIRDINHKLVRLL